MSSVPRRLLDLIRSDDADARKPSRPTRQADAPATQPPATRRSAGHVDLATSSTHAESERGWTDAVASAADSARKRHAAVPDHPGIGTAAVYPQAGTPPSLLYIPGLYIIPPVEKSLRFQ